MSKGLRLFRRQSIRNMHTIGSKRWGVLVYSDPSPWTIHTFPGHANADLKARSEAALGHDNAVVEVRIVRHRNGK